MSGYQAIKRSALDRSRSAGRSGPAGSRCPPKHTHVLEDSNPRSEASINMCKLVSELPGIRVLQMSRDVVPATRARSGRRVRRLATKRRPVGGATQEVLQQAQPGGRSTQGYLGPGAVMLCTQSLWPLGSRAPAGRPSCQSTDGDRFFAAQPQPSPVGGPAYRPGPHSTVRHGCAPVEQPQSHCGHRDARGSTPGAAAPHADELARKDAVTSSGHQCGTRRNRVQYADETK